MDVVKSHFKRLLLLSTIILIITVAISSLSIVNAPVVSESIDKTEEMEVIHTSGHAPTLIKMNSTNILVDGAICSCGANSHNYQRHEQSEFKNYCPFCKIYDVLIIHNGWYKNTNIPEFETSCQGCGADFCLVDGCEKSGSFRAKLKKI